MGNMPVTVRHPDFHRLYFVVAGVEYPDPVAAGIPFVVVMTGDPNPLLPIRIATALGTVRVTVYRVSVMAPVAVALEGRVR